MSILFSTARRAAFVLWLAMLILMTPPLLAGMRYNTAGASTDTIETASLSGSYLAGLVAGSLRDAPAAALYYRRALEQDPDNMTLLDRSFVLSLIAGEMDEAMDLAARILAKDDSHRIARLALATKAIRARQYAEARRHLAQSGSGPLAELTSSLLLAWTSRGMGDTAEGLERISALEGPNWYEVFKPYHSGLISELAGDSDAAGRFFGSAYEGDQGALRIVQAWSRHLARTGRTDDALAVLAGFTATVPNHPIIVSLAKEIAAGRTPPPIVSSPREGAAEVFYGIGSALGSESGEEYAAIYLQLALYLAPGQPLALLSLANYYENVGDPERAIEAYEAVPESSPLRRNADVHRALNLNELDQLDEARAILDGLVESAPDDSEAIVALGNILRGRELFEEAAEVYSQAIAQIDTPQTQHWMLYYFRGISYERSNRWDAAEADLKLALELYPDQPHVLNYLGYSWIDQGLHLEEALEMIAKAVELRPDDGYIVDSLGWAYYRLGRYDDAVSELVRAVELRPEDPVINDHLGDAYWKVGRKLEARFQWSHARDLDPEPDDLEAILKKLDQGLPDEIDRAAADLTQAAD